MAAIPLSAIVYTLYYTLPEMDSVKFQPVDLSKSICPVPGIKVLVVDSNLTFLESVSKMLRNLGYEVVTASLASDALSIVEEKKNELNLVFVDVHLPDMEINALIEKIREISDLPYFLMTADENLFNTSIEQCNGSKWFFKKPIMISDLSGLWKFATRRREEGRIAASEDVRGFGQLQSGENIVNNSGEGQPLINTGEQILQSAKRKVQEHKIEEEQSESLVLKRKRLSWTDDSRTEFLGAVELAGTNEAPPNQVRPLWNVPEITRDNDADYLQRLHQPLEQANPIQQHSNVHSSDMNLGSQHLSQTVNDIGERIRSRNNQIYICYCMYLRSLCNTVSAHSIPSSSGQIPTLGQSQMFLPWELLDVAYYTPGSGEFVSNAEISQVDGKVFSEDSCVYCGDDLADQSEMDFSTLLANDMCQEFPQLLPVPLLPSDENEKEKEHGNFGALAGQVDEIFYPPNGLQQFSDEDLMIWLSRLFPRYEYARMFMNIYDVSNENHFHLTA
ncbi:Two-component response regulator ORR26, partial [Mucuna pruriens]